MTEFPPHSGTVLSVNVSNQKGASKHPVPEITLDDAGIIGDAHAGPGNRQVRLLAAERIEEFGVAAGRTFEWGDFAENITTRGVDLRQAALLDRLEIGAALLEVTQLGKTCHADACAIFREVGRCVMPQEGIFCRVLRGGVVRPGDVVAHTPRPLRVRMITLSDRADRGEYEDRSGPRIEKLLRDHYEGSRRRLILERAVLPDDAARLKAGLQDARDAGMDVVFTTGGTGIGPRDITPDVVTAMADRIIPGIMEHIRVTYGASKPNALLSRSVAAVLGRTLVFTLPGSVKAVNEYLSEILKILDHAIHMLHGLDTH